MHVRSLQRRQLEQVAAGMTGDQGHQGLAGDGKLLGARAQQHLR